MVLEELEKMTGFTAQERAAAEFIKKNLSRMDALSARQIAEASFVSQATIARLCKKAGARNYHDFKLRLVSEYLQIQHIREFLQEESLTENSTCADVVKILPRFYETAIANTCMLLNEKVMVRIQNKLLQAKRIDLYGQGINYSVAEQGAFKFSSLGIDSMAYNGLNEHWLVANKGYLHRVAILISFTSKNPTILQIGRYLKQQGIYVIGICGCKTASFSAICHEVIEIDTKNQFLSMEVLTAVVEVQYILDLFFSLILVANYQKNIKIAMDVLHNPFQ